MIPSVHMTSIVHLVHTPLTHTSHTPLTHLLFILFFPLFSSEDLEGLSRLQRKPKPREKTTRGVIYIRQAANISSSGGVMDRGVGGWGGGPRKEEQYAANALSS